MSTTNHKDAYYFSHDSNARNDIKMIRLRRQLGLNGYGAYWCLIEMLRDAPDYKLPLSFVEDISHSISLDPTTLNSVISDFELFSKTDTHFFSERLIRSMELYNSKRQVLSEAGKKGMNKRWNKRPRKIPNI